MLGQYVAAGSSWSYDLLKLKVYECTKLTWAELSHALKVHECNKLTWAELSHALKVYECTKLMWAEFSHTLKVYECTKLTSAQHSHTLLYNWPTTAFHHPNRNTAKNLSAKITTPKSWVHVIFKASIWELQSQTRKPQQQSHLWCLCLLVGLEHSKP